LSILADSSVQSNILFEGVNYSRVNATCWDRYYSGKA